LVAPGRIEYLSGAPINKNAPCDEFAGGRHLVEQARVERTRPAARETKP
jgi:hypothetical protein